MTWLLKLYPPRWRRRYGREFTDLMAGQPFSSATVVDVLAGAIDAWIYPQSSTASRTTTNSRREGATVTTKMLHLSCAGNGPAVTATDRRKSLGVMLGGTLLLTLIWLWSQSQFRGNAYVESMPVMAFVLPYLISLRYTHLKERRGGVQAIFIAVNAIVAIAILLAAAWLGTRI